MSTAYVELFPGIPLLLLLIYAFLRLVIPSPVTQLVALLRDPMLGYVVSCPELMKQGNNLTVYTHLLVQTHLVVATIYVAVNVALTRLVSWPEPHGPAGPCSDRPDR